MMIEDLSIRKNVIKFSGRKLKYSYNQRGPAEIA